MAITIHDAYSSQDYRSAAQAILQAIGAPATEDNIRLVVAWIWSEKPHNATSEAWQWNNPLNTTRVCCGGVNVPGNRAGVKIYPSRAQGIEATRQTLLNGLYPHLVEALRRSDPAEFFRYSSEIRTWGTNPTNILSSFRALGGNPGVSAVQVDQPAPSTQQEETAPVAPVGAAGPAPANTGLVAAGVVTVGLLLALGIVLVLWGMEEAA